MQRKPTFDGDFGVHTTVDRTVAGRPPPSPLFGNSQLTQRFSSLGVPTMKPLKAPQFPNKPDNYEVFVRDNILHSCIPEWERHDEDFEERQLCGLAVFANRETYRYLSRFFYALSRNLTDEMGDHYHLTPNSPSPISSTSPSSCSQRRTALSCCCTKASPGIRVTDPRSFS